MSRASLAIFVSLLVFLTGCSSSGGGSSYVDLVAQGQNLVSRFQNQPLTPVGNMPTGSAVYNGVAAISTETPFINSILANPEAVARVSLNANFDAGAISGSMSNFVDRNDATYAGSINLNGGRISGNTIAAGLTGRANIRGEMVNIVGELEGEFLGANANAVSARFGGTGGGVQFWGLLGAER